MSPLIPKFVRVAYRKEPLSSFLLIMGIVDSLIGGLNERPPLLSFGIILVVTSLGLRWWYSRHTKEIAIPTRRSLYLPPAPDRSTLPVLHSKKRV